MNKVNEINSLKDFYNLKPSKIYIFPKSSKGIGLYNILKKRFKGIKFIDNCIKGKNIFKLNSNDVKNSSVILVDIDKQKYLKNKSLNVHYCYYDNFVRIFENKKLTNKTIILKKKYVIKKLRDKESKEIYNLIINSILEKNNKKLHNFFIEKFKRADTIKNMYYDYLKKINIKNPTVLDIGSSEGEFLSQIKKYHKTYNYFGFDPLANKDINLQDISINRMGIGRYDGFAKIIKKKILNQTQIKKCSKNNSTIKVLKIDTFMKLKKINKLDIIKVDVEGDEENVLAGAWKSIKKYRPSLFISCYHGPNQFLNIPYYLMKNLTNYTFEIRTYRCDGMETKIYCLPKNIK